MKNLKKITIVMIIFVMTLANTTLMPAASSGGGQYGIITSWTGDATTSFTVTWHEPKGKTGQYIEYDTSGTFANSKKVKASQSVIKANVTLEDSVYSAELSDLNAGTTYWYRVGNSSGVSESHNFSTEASGKDSASFMYLGDIQFTDSMEEEYAEWGTLVKNAYLRNRDISFGMIGGDIVQSGVKEKEWTTFLKNASPVFSEISLMPVNGNHESNFLTGKPQLYLDFMSLPQNGPKGFEEEFYSFDYGNCHITGLNSWVFSGEQGLTDSQLSEITKWIEKDISSSNADWKIVVMHNPIYALAEDSVSDKVKENWEPVFENTGVDLVFVGHQHVYSRSYPLKDGVVDKTNGIVYIMGNSGQKFYSSAEERYSESIIYEIPTYQIVRASANKLTVSTEDKDGNCLDSVSLTARNNTSDINGTNDSQASGVPDPVKESIRLSAKNIMNMLMQR